jgi:hypothetical protein
MKRLSGAVGRARSSFAASALHLLAATLTVQVAAAQSPEPVATLSDDSVALAEVFELRIELPVPAGSVVYFPDTVPATADVESHGPVEWRSRRGPDGGATLELTYPLMPFSTGNVRLPPVEIMTMPREDGADGERIPGGSLVGFWLDAPPALRYSRSVPEQVVWVEPLYTAEDIAEGLSPRPPGDVLGFSWSWPSAALILLFSTVIGGAVVTTTRGWLARRGEPVRAAPAGPLSVVEARRQALEELDGLIAAGPYPPERAHGLYGRSSDIVRRYVERLDPAWGPELTSTELMRGLEGRSLAGGGAAEEMGRAEAVKFGRLRPAAGATEGHLLALRAWIGGSKEGAS